MTAAGSDERRDTWRGDLTVLDELFSLLATNQDDEADYVYVMRSEVRSAEEALARVAGELERLERERDDLLAQRYDLQNSVGGYIVSTDELCRQRGEAWNELARLRYGLRRIAEMDRQGYALRPVDLARSLLSGGQAESTKEQG